MNENIDLTKILKDCPKGTKLYSTVYGDVSFKEIIDVVYPIAVSCKDKHTEYFKADGKVMIDYDGECCIFPSREQRDWSKFSAPWLKKEKFDPKTLKPFDKVLVRDGYKERWLCRFFSHIVDGEHIYKYITIGSGYKYCIPYNDETEHLVDTAGEAPEYYKYWED